jgi:cyclic pyranopterin phosphate synthase
MPFDGNKWNTKKMVPYREMLKLVASKYNTDEIERLQDDPNDTSKVIFNPEKIIINFDLLLLT